MLQISTRNAELDIRVTRARLDMRQPPADIQMHQKHPKIIMHKEPIQIQIDQTQCFNESGRMTTTALADHISQLGQQAIMEGISRASGEGDRMAKIELKSDAFAEIAYNNSYTVYEYNVGTMPRSRPKIDFVGGNLDIQVEEGYVDLKVTPNSPQFDYYPGKVDIRLKQYPHISFEFVGNNVDTIV
ncbi:DUF6470 family protein [Lutispora sp.]|uniref:DUF6470 family protein n=1 Tax=Lutispora sp. TaxID=2828727 RepID=UPI00356985A7